jgi:hypothetical protein
MEKAMPFDDNRHHVPGDALERIDKVIALLATEDKWCKFFAESSDGRRCLWGAMRAEDAASVLEPPILDAIRQVTGRFQRCIDAFNDHPATTHALVLKVLYQARHNIRTAALHTAPQYRWEPARMAPIASGRAFFG